MKNRWLLILFLIFFSNYLSAQNNVEKNEVYFEELIQSTRNLLRSQKYKETINLSSQLIEEGEKYNSKRAKFIGYDILGSVYTNLLDTTKARVNTEKALEIAIETKNDSLIAWANLNMGNVYSDRKGAYKKAINYFEKSLEYYSSVKDYESVYLTYINIEWTLVDQNQFDEAYKYMLKAKRLEGNHKISEGYTIYNKVMLAKYYYHKKQLDLAEQTLLETIKVVDKDSILDLGEETYEYLTKIYQNKGHYKKAFESLKKERHYSEVSREETGLSAIEVANAKYDLKQSKKDLEYAEKTARYSKIIIGILALAIVGFIFLIRSRKKFIDKLSTKNKELTNAKDKAEKLSKVKSQFFSTVSHELRTPLYGVVGISSILQEDKNLKAYEQELNSLKFSADYLLALINDVLLLNKMDYQDLVLEKVPFQLNSLVNSITKSFEYSLQQNKNKFIVDIDEKVPNNLIGSSVRISQILMNLIGNATKFNENGSIWLSIKPQGLTHDGLNKVLFIIKDDGIGIAKDKQESIFKEFSQVESNNYSHKGTGLGLPIVKKLLELHNSDIHLESELGKGTVFSFTLELLENTNANTSIINQDISTEEIKSALISKHKNIHILVVDDNKINQKVTQGILKKNNIKSSVAGDGEEAVSLVKQNNYSLILMDINMPKMDGIEATKIIRTFNESIPIIALTAVEVEEMRVKILDSGMNDILAKPYGGFQFLSTILRYLE